MILYSRVHAMQVNQWSDPIELIQGRDFHDEVAVTVDPFDNIHVLWASGDDEDEPVAFFYSGWDGRQWTNPIDVLAQDSLARWPSTASDPDGESLFLIWQGQEALLYFSSASGPLFSLPQSWTKPIPISQDQVTHSDIEVDVTGKIHVLYGGANGGVFYTSSDNGGESWALPQDISGDPGVGGDFPRLAIDAHGRLHAVWTAFTLPDGVPIIGTFYSRSDDGGVSWLTPRSVTVGPNLAQINVLSVGEDQIHLAWNGVASFGGRYHQWSSDGGQNWSPIMEIIPRTEKGDGRTGPPAMVVDRAGTVHLVSGLNPGGLMHLFWKDGQWSTPHFIPSPSGWAEKVRMVVTGGNQLNIFWQGWNLIGHTSAPRRTPPAKPTQTLTESTPLPENVERPIAAPALNGIGQIEMDRQQPRRPIPYVSILLSAVSAALVIAAGMLWARR